MIGAATSVCTLLARRTGAAGVVEQLNTADTRLVADNRLCLPGTVAGAAVTGGVVQRVHLDPSRHCPEAKTVVSIAGTAAYWPSDVGRRATEVSAGCVESHWRRVVDQVARFRITSYHNRTRSQNLKQPRCAKMILPRCMKCRRGPAMGILSVRLSVYPSVRPSNACIVTKRKKAVCRFLHHTKEHLS